MKFHALAFVLLFAFMYLSLAQGSFDDCCLGYVVSLPKNAMKNIVGYRTQRADGDCNISAVVFQMRKRRAHKKQKTVCANPEDAWVKEKIESMNRRAQS
ncbi:C-C motif chemokine 25b [Stegastes partitus]|uniref:C-C motif chemokine 25-like n=1 Tax=Stegastes partitus TaxID=144197 RepID=A0A9Y4K9Q0_9TELE|nr:PREDICTED: C-C motif chemokine 25-like [Stegastes partitus]XP_008290830.1 PREDICTED: C-C motif chemokine 25-like [Stegastes partitus]